jgi:hypothetical protein
MPQDDPIDSTKLKNSIIIPALELPVPRHRNIIWCSSFQLAWNRVAPIHIADMGEVVKFLNQTEISEEDLEADSYYISAGPFTKDTIDGISRDLRKRFSLKQTISSERSYNSNHFLIYAFLKVHMRFHHPFQDLQAGMEFIGSDGKGNKVRGFGFSRDQSHSMGAATFQVEVLYQDVDKEEFILDLSSGTKPYQLIVAKIALLDTLANTIRELYRRIIKFPNRTMLIPGNSLSVPNLEFDIKHRYQELEFEPIAEAGQRVKFKLDRFGAELDSSAEMKLIGIGSEEYNLDRPFLILMKKRDGRHPFFVAWLDNADLLKPM